MADLLNGRTEAIELFALLIPSRTAISVLTYIELLEGIRGGPDSQRHELGLRRVLKPMKVHGVSRSVAERAAEIRIELRAQQRPIERRAFDIVIAATAIEHGLTLVTRNARDYADIEWLTLYDPVS